MWNVAGKIAAIWLVCLVILPAFTLPVLSVLPVDGELKAWVLLPALMVLHIAVPLVVTLYVVGRALYQMGQQRPELRDYDEYGPGG